MTESGQESKTSKYADILELPHHVSEIHPQMSRYDRAAQFSPFAALTGHEEAIREAQRLTEQKAELAESKAEQLGQKLQMLEKAHEIHPMISVVYFQKDTNKEGGAYLTEEGRFVKIHVHTKELELETGVRIPIMDISEINGELFRDF